MNAYIVPESVPVQTDTQTVRKVVAYKIMAHGKVLGRYQTIHTAEKILAAINNPKSEQPPKAVGLVVTDAEPQARTAK